MINYVKKLCLLAVFAVSVLESSSEAATTNNLRGGPAVGELDHDDEAVKGGMPARIATTPTKYPFFTNLKIDIDGRGTVGTCGGAVIHDDIVLTAAHCRARFAAGTTVYMLNQVKHTGGINRTVTQVVDHPSFRTGPVDRYGQRPLFFDYALLKLDSSALVMRHLSHIRTGVVPLPMNQNPAVPAPANSVIMMGFGNFITEPVEVPSEILLEARALYVPDSQCKFSANPEINCITHTNTGVCRGDSGGPVLDVATMTAIGLVSFGPTCTPASGGTDKLADVQAGFDWIKTEACKLTSFKTGLCTPTPTPAPVVTAAPVTAAPVTGTPTTGTPTTLNPTPVPTVTPPRIQNFTVTNTFVFPANYTPSTVSKDQLATLERTSDVYYTRLIASDFNLNFDEVEVKFNATNQHAQRMREVNIAVRFNVEVEYRTDKGVPAVALTLAALVGTPQTRALYASDFASIAGGIFKDVESVRTFVAPRS